MNTCRMALILLVALLVAGCPMEEKTGAEGKANYLDPRLVGAWQLNWGQGIEEFKVEVPAAVIGAQEENYLGGTFTSGGYSADGGNYRIGFAGSIEYAESFDTQAGILIIKYMAGYENSWRGRERTGDYYGIYYINLKGDGAAGSTIFFACTNDQKSGNGPTETTTLEAAKAKFTAGNMNNMLDLSVGDPQTKVE